MRARTRFGWLITLVSVLCLVFVVVGVILFVAARNPGDVSSSRLQTPDPHAQPTATPTLPPGNDWTQYRYDLAGTGVNPENIINSSNVTRLRSAWVHDNKGSPYESTPAIVDGVIYIPSGNSLSAYNLFTGAKLWTFNGIKPAHGGTNSSVAVDITRHLAYYGAPNGYVYAIDTASGRSVWLEKLGEPDEGAHIWSSPILMNGAIYIGLASNSDNPCVRGAVFAIDGGSGAIRWTHYTAPEGELGGGVWSSVTVDPDDHAILATTGNPCTSRVSDYEQDSIVAMDWDTGKTIWKYTALGTDDCDCDFGQGPVAYTIGGQKYIVAGNKYGVLYGLARTATGVRLAWSRRIARSDSTYAGGIFEPPSYKDGIIYAGSGAQADGSCAGAVWALRGDTGEVVWKKCASHSIVSPGAISGDVLFVAHTGGELNAYDLKTGAVRWHAAIPGPIFGGTAISRGHVVIGALSGKLYCFSLGGG